MSSLILLAKAESFAITIYSGLKNMPSFERHAMTADIKRTIVNMVTAINLAESVRSKRLTYAQEADGYLESLMLLLRMCKSKHLRYISTGFYDRLYELYDDIKKLLVGFIKSAAKR